VQKGDGVNTGEKNGKTCQGGASEEGTRSASRLHKTRSGRSCTLFAVTAVCGS